MTTFWKELFVFFVRVCLCSSIPFGLEDGICLLLPFRLL